MSKLRSVLFLGLVVFVPGALGAPLKDDKATEILKKAIKALGDEKTILADTQGRTHSEGVVHSGEEKIVYTAENTYSGVCEHTKLTMTIGCSRIEASIINNGKTVSCKVDKQKHEFSAEMIDDIIQSYRQNRILQIAPIFTDRMTYKLESETAKVGDVETYQFEVKSEQIKPVQIFIDKKSYRILKLQCPGIGDGNKAVKRETFFFDYEIGKENKYLHPMRIEVFHDGKINSSFKLTKHEKLDKVDPKLFEIDE